MTSIVGCVPLAANIRYNAAIVSNNQEVVFRLMAAPTLMPDVERMRNYATEMFQALLAAAEKGTGTKPTPGQS